MRTRPIPASNLKIGRDGRVKRRNLFWRWRRLFYLVGLVMVTGVTGAGFVVAQIELPTAPPVEDQTTFVCAADVAPGTCTKETSIASFHGEEDRVNVALEDVPQVAVNAVIATEDRDFFEHGGVDPVGITRAALSDIRGSSASQQGGSTITQQYVKNTYLTSERTLTRKIREAVMAIKLEQEISKEQILENYLNTIYFGRGSYGIGAASRSYFDKDVSELTLPEAALLAGLIRSPQRAEPYRYPEEAKRRRRTVLDAMLEEGMISAQERDLADEWPFDVYHDLALWTPSNGVDVEPSASVFGADYFVEYVRREVTARYGSDAVFGGGLRIYTTLDLDLQQDAYQSVTEVLDQPGDPVGALVAIDDNGEVKAMMGGEDYADEPAQPGRARRRRRGPPARARRSSPSPWPRRPTRASPSSPPSRRPPPRSSRTRDDGDDWKVRGGCCGGQANLIEATASSSNTAFAQLMIDLGPEAVADMATALGVEADLSGDLHPSLVLGTANVSVLDMAGAYSTFANLGTRIEPRVVTRVERADGSLVEEFTADRETGPLDPGGRRRHLRPRAGHRPRHRRRPPPSAVRPPARPAPPRRTATPGSWATPPGSPRRRGWATSTTGPWTTCGAGWSRAVTSRPRSGPPSCNAPWRGRTPRTSSTPATCPRAGCWTRPWARRPPARRAPPAPRVAPAAPGAPARRRPPPAAPPERAPGPPPPRVRHSGRHGGRRHGHREAQVPTASRAPPTTEGPPPRVPTASTAPRTTTCPGCPGRAATAPAAGAPRGLARRERRRRRRGPALSRR